jgi:hypothetical protein
VGCGRCRTPFWEQMVAGSIPAAPTITFALDARSLPRRAPPPSVTSGDYARRELMEITEANNPSNADPIHPLASGGVSRPMQLQLNLCVGEVLSSSVRCLPSVPRETGSACR